MNCKYSCNAGHEAGNQESNMNVAKQVQNVLANEFKAGEAKMAYAALDMAHDLDRHFEDVTDKAKFLAEKSARYVAELAETKRVTGMNNPTGYASLLFDIAKAQEAYEATHRSLRTMLSAAFGHEVMVACMTGNPA